MELTIDLDHLPQHVAFIMDGNGRWAKSKNLPRKAGHKAGSESLKKLIDGADKLGIKYISVYALSTENLNRPQDEVTYLLGLMESYIDENTERADKNNYRLQVIGDLSRLNDGLVAKIKKLETITSNKMGLHFTIAISYGGRDEIIRATKKIATQAIKGSFSAEDIDEALFERFLDTGSTPDPDLIIRTSGELRMSNFLIWQAAYSELYFTNKYWPDFNTEDLKVAICDYQNRNRRFGKL